MRKRRTREHVIADLSVNHVERFILRCGWTVERKRYDYGIDLIMDTYTGDGEVQNDRILLHLKATDSLRRSADGITAARKILTNPKRKRGQPSLTLRVGVEKITCRRNTVIPVRLEWRDLLYWLNEPLPVLLIFYDAHEERAYWLYVQEYFRGQRWQERAGQATTVTVHVPVSNVVDEAAIRLFGQFRDACRDSE